MRPPNPNTHSELAKIINGADVLAENGRRVGEEKNGTKVESLGFETIDDIYCRKFLITQEIEFSPDQKSVKGASGKSKLEITVWENYGARQLYRIEMLNSAWVVRELVSILSEDFNPLPVEAFNIDKLLQDCDVEGFFPPSTIDPSRITDIIVSDPAWGVFSNTVIGDSNGTAIGDSNGLRHSSDLQVQHAPGALDPTDKQAFSKALREMYHKKHKEYNTALLRRTMAAGCDNGCCVFSTDMLGDTIEDLMKKTIGISGSIKFCYDNGIDPGIQIIYV